MQNALLFYEAITAIKAQEEQAPSQNGAAMLQRTLTIIGSELDDTDYFYLSVFAQALSEAKKLSTANDFPFEHLGLFAHSLRESSVSGS
ncbi:hypothetical protein [Gallibacterium anatis]|uniref:Uncharacterized protein n=1 Tax=Gallibacterium anatis TaxID=750 RepID=A0A1A7P6G6_9PAST|nr:hypothetical protein [Gallibacterium anatis]MBP4133529.1 hypothetical protein [Gallibacterium anatis]OBW96698.1 hypothetical protein QV02_03130 [Gallibacterium anatis]OBW98057.1 hypothetical protein QV03_07920 [Gallibacterium anatis]